MNETQGEPTMNQLTVALLQLTWGGNDQDANKAKGELFCRRAQAMGADIALFPELWNVGYTPAHTWQGTDELWRAPELWPPEEANANVVQPQSEDLWADQAIGRDDPFILHFRDLAKASWRNTLVVEAGERECIFFASFDLDAIRAYRTYETEGNAFRKPHRYGLLTSPDVAESFVRVSATGEPFDRTKR